MRHRIIGRSLRGFAGIPLVLTVTSGCVSAENTPQSEMPITISVKRDNAVNAEAAGKRQAQSQDLFVAVDGAATNPGTRARPTSLQRAIAQVQPGQTIWLQGGTYKLSQSLIIAPGNDGTAKEPKRIFALDGAAPVLDFSAQAVANANRGLVVNGNFWHLKGLVVEHAGDNGIYIGGSHNTIELCETRFNADSGLQLGRASSSLTDSTLWPSHNVILNCTSHDNKDPGNENADGFACKLTTGQGNVFRGCIAYHNIDDGWDLFAKKETGPIGPVLLEDCVAYSNGSLADGTTSGSGDKNGFKLGGSGIAVPHIVRRCVAFDNGKHGFTDNNNPGPIEVLGNLSVRNKECNFNFRTGGTHVFTGNFSFQSGQSDKFTGTLTGTSNVFWHNKKGSQNNGGTATASEDDFVSLTPPSQVTRDANGAPDLGDFLRLKPNSDLVALRAASEVPAAKGTTR